MTLISSQIDYSHRQQDGIKEAYKILAEGRMARCTPNQAINLLSKVSRLDSWQIKKMVEVPY